MIQFPRLWRLGQKVVFIRCFVDNYYFTICHNDIGEDSWNTIINVEFLIVSPLLYFFGKKHWSREPHSVIDVLDDTIDTKNKKKFQCNPEQWDIAK